MLKEGKIIVWDYKNHKQFELDTSYFLRLLEISSGSQPFFNSVIDQELLQADLVKLNSGEIDWKWDPLSKIFHFGTQVTKDDIKNNCLDNPKGFISQYINYCESSIAEMPQLFIEKKGSIVKLPDPDFTLFSHIDFLITLKKRRTSRSFNGKKISLLVLSTLLKVVFGEITESANKDFKEIGFDRVGLRKTSPSGGGLHPTEAYLLVKNVDGLDEGIYHYRAHKHELSKISSVQNTDLTEILCGQYFVDGLSFGIFLTSHLDKIWHKYQHSRAYRVALLDVGHISQTFQLVATALGLSTWLTGAFCDEEVIEILQLDNESEQPFFFVGAGYGCGSSFDETARNLIQNECK